VSDASPDAACERFLPLFGARAPDRIAANKKEADGWKDLEARRQWFAEGFTRVIHHKSSFSLFGHNKSDQGRMIAASTIQSKILAAARSSDQYALYRAALEWDLTDPIVIESPEDVKSAARWRDRVEPFHHQVTNLITFCRRLPVTLLADDVGLGKTISAGLIMSELIARARLSRALIVAPKLLGPQWKEELEWKFDIPAQVVAGRELLKADPGDLGAVVTTYQSAREYLEKLPADRFQMLILDEAHKLRNLYGVEKPPQVAVRFRKALQERRFPYVLMLTATPIQNRLWDLYSLVDLLTVARGHDNPFGSEGTFVRKFILGDREKARQLKPEAADRSSTDTCRESDVVTPSCISRIARSSCTESNRRPRRRS
jgi:hypothetical protein